MATTSRFPYDVRAPQTFFGMNPESADEICIEGTLFDDSHHWNEELLNLDLTSLLGDPRELSSMSTFPDPLAKLEAILSSPSVSVGVLSPILLAITAKESDFASAPLVPEDECVHRLEPSLRLHPSTSSSTPANNLRTSARNLKHGVQVNQLTSPADDLLDIVPSSSSWSSGPIASMAATSSAPASLVVPARLSGLHRRSRRGCHKRPHSEIDNDDGDECHDDANGDIQNALDKSQNASEADGQRKGKGPDCYTDDLARREGLDPRAAGTEPSDDSTLIDIDGPGKSYRTLLLQDEHYTRVHRAKDRSEEEERYLRRQLKKQVGDLEMCTRLTQYLSSSERKKLRNRKASRVSRLKKKLSVFDLQDKYNQLAHERAIQDRTIAAMQAEIDLHVALIQRYEPTFQRTTLSRTRTCRDRSSPSACIDSTCACTISPAVAVVTTRKASRKSASKVPKDTSAVAQDALHGEDSPTEACAVAREASNEDSAMALEQRYCVCRDVAHDAMVQCTDCLDWFHLACVGLTAAEADALPVFVCPSCQPVPACRESSYE